MAGPTTGAGCSWRDAPQDRYGSWMSVDRRFRDWQRNGSCALLADRLRTLADGGRADRVGPERGLHGRRRSRPPPLTRSKTRPRHLPGLRLHQ
ncbi:transposase [Promicromonospora vindobonensis]|uniref:Transposase n=1 Tax=Promicromonospora vindobonensis TaxID=195748 RepID=A0ABW5VX62_9MICO